VEEAYHALRVFFATARDPRFAAWITYRPGDLIAMDNRRLLHGREAYDQGTGERWLQGCYGEREELYLRLRVLTR
jgi:gamma-butyrobetaine dioxygenase